MVIPARQNFQCHLVGKPFEFLPRGSLVQGARGDLLGDGRSCGCLIPCCISIPSTASPSGNCVYICLPSGSLCLKGDLISMWKVKRPPQGSVPKEHTDISY